MSISRKLAGAAGIVFGSVYKPCASMLCFL